MARRARAIIQDRLEQRCRRTLPSSRAATRNRDAAREEVPAAEGRQRPRGIAHERVSVRPQRAHEQQLAPFQLRDREAVLARGTSANGICRLGHVEPRLPHLARHVLEQRDLLRREVGPLEERAPVLEVAVGVRLGQRTDGEGPSRSSSSSAPSPRAWRAPRPAAAPRRRAEDLVGRDRGRVREVAARAGPGWRGCGARGRRAPARRCVRPVVSGPKTSAAPSSGASAATSAAISRTSRAGPRRAPCP